ncbi:MAG: tetratricopeptide repeat protein [Pseudomonadota bacterium]
MRTRLLMPLIVAGLAIGAPAAANSTATTDAATALASLRPRAERGDAEAQYRLGRLYYYDAPGVPRDYRLAFRWFRLAALQGHAGAQYKLGGMYFSGRGVAADDRQAVVWWSKAAAQFQPESLNNLGALFANGRGVARDPLMAYALQTLAHAHGEENAAANLRAKRARMDAAAIAAAEALAAELSRPGVLARRLTAPGDELAPATK